MPMPSRAASAGEWIRTARLSMKISPEVGRWTPARHLPSVLLPAPFSPISAWQPPCLIDSDTSASACTPANDFEIPRNSMKPSPTTLLLAQPFLPLGTEFLGVFLGDAGQWIDHLG